MAVQREIGVRVLGSVALMDIAPLNEALSQKMRGVTEIRKVLAHFVA
jgi:hypothetical protein